MTRDEALQHCQAYHDKQLDPKLAAEIELLLKSDSDLARAYQNQRAFNGLLVRAGGAPVPAGDFQERLRAKLATSMATPAAPPLQIPVAAPGRRRWTALKLVAAIAFVAGAGLIWHTLHPDECPYLVACAGEHATVLNGKAPLELTSSDAKALADFVSDKTKSTVALPAGLNALKPVGAGTAKFASLRTAPQGAFVRYDESGSESVTVLLHPWPEETPMAMNLRTYKGKEFWSARHGEFSVAAWKSADGKLLCSVISRRPKDEVLDLAFDVSEALAKKSAAARFAPDIHAVLASTDPIEGETWR